MKSLEQLNQKTVSASGLSDVTGEVKVESYFSSDQFFYVKESDVMTLITYIQRAKKSQVKIENWAGDDVRERFSKIRQTVVENAYQIAGIEASFQGTTRQFQNRWNVQPIVDLIDHLLSQMSFFDQSAPKGLIGAVTPKFQSFYEIGWRILYALFHKDGLIVKPATETALAGYIWQEILAECDLPEGLISFVYGPGVRVGKFLLDHPGVKNISFSGAYETLKNSPLSLEKKYQFFFNGKNSVCLLPDFDFKTHMQDIVALFVEHNGRSVFSPTRLFVVDSIEAEFKAALANYLVTIPILKSIDDQFGILPLKSFEQQALNQTKRAFQKEEGKLIFENEQFGFFSDLANCSELYQNNLELPIYNLTAVKYVHEMAKWINNNSFGHSMVVFGPPEKAKKLILKAEVGAALFNPHPLSFKPITPVKMSGFGEVDRKIPNSFFSYCKTSE